jgi:subtilisin family serine protease
MGTCWLALFDAGQARASAFTPLQWQQKGDQHSALPEQRKHRTWNRDQNPRDFIDDQIQLRFESNQRVNVIVDLNQWLSSPAIHELLSRYGLIRHIDKLITFVLLDGVLVKSLPEIAKKPMVAMVEWQIPFYDTNSVSTRTIEARKSLTYSGTTAEDKGYTGAGVNIAIVDSGVDNRHKAFRLPSHFDDPPPCILAHTRFMAGYDASRGDVKNDRNDFCFSWDHSGHGTHVAGTALGLPTLQPPPQNCLPPLPDAIPTDCGGVAPNAGFVDIKVCIDPQYYYLYGLVDNTNPCAFLPQGLEWIGLNAQDYKIRVANISLSTRCGDDDGSSAIPQQVDYLASLGIAVVIAHGNAYPEPLPPENTNPPYCEAGKPFTSSPGSSSFGMAVAATENDDVDNYTIMRDDDVFYNGGLSGPRSDFSLNPSLFALKPDFSAPGVDIVSAKVDTLNEYDVRSGTSMAAPHVAGAAALLIEARPTIDPGSLKDLLRRKADSRWNGPAHDPSFDPVWEPRLGSGMITVGQALLELMQDVGFPNCVIGPPSTPGGLCQVTAPEPPWNNTFDITTATPPAEGVPNTITAQVHNYGTSPATVFIKFGVYEFGVGNNQFFEVGIVRADVPAMQTVSVPQNWTPAGANHRCIQVSIEYGLDSDFRNNVTQRNIQISPSVDDMEMRVENPFMVPVRIEIRPKSNREGWICQVKKEEAFMLSPFEDGPRNLSLALTAPHGALPGETANCNFAVYATPRGSEKPVLIGGVTAQTFVPKPIRKPDHPVP